LNLIKLFYSNNHIKIELKNVAIFASGTGTNAKNIVNYFKNNTSIKISVLVTNKPDSGVFEIGKNNDIPVVLISKDELGSTEFIEKLKTDFQINLIVLAGFLLLIPSNLVAAFKDKMINIHPSLLPKFGGKGMYGMHVHRAVFEANETKTGISIHYVNEVFDEGKIIAQFSCDISDLKSPEEIAAKNQQLEYKHYPEVIEEILSI
jgi:phosphoribosylglycinamide formyltransferase 1